jgi:hypothetical protein
VVAAIVIPESTKPMVRLRDPVAVFVRPGLRLRPLPPFVRGAPDPSIKHKAMLLLLPVPIIQRAPLAKRVQHQHHPLIVSVPIVMPITIKMTLRLLELHAHRGPPVVPEKRDPHRLCPLIVSVPIVMPITIKMTLSLLELHAHRGPHATLEKKDPHHLCLLIGFVPIVTRANFKPRVHRPRIPVLFVLLEKVLWVKPPFAPIATVVNFKINPMQRRLRVNFAPPGTNTAPVRRPVVSNVQPASTKLCRQH